MSLLFIDEQTEELKMTNKSFLFNLIDNNSVPLKGIIKGFPQQSPAADI